MKVRDFSKIFFSILLLHIVVIYKPESEVLYMISKPLLMFSLLAFFIHRTAKVLDASKNWITAALLISMCGDIILLKDEEIFLFIGIGALLVANIFYIIFYFRQQAGGHPAMVALATVLAGGAVFSAITFVEVPEALSYYFYGILAIAGFHFIKSVQFSATFWKTVWPVSLGALLFLVFVAIIIFYKGDGGNKYWHMAAMLAYGLGQYGITVGVINYYEIKEKAGKI